MENQNGKSGFMLVDKPAGLTSFGVVAKLRKITGMKKIGHAGTLDPFATGLLFVAIGRSATRRLQEFVKQDKVYETVLCLGAVSSTHDPEGEIKDNDIPPDRRPDQEEIKKVISGFIGKQQQTPPMHSAKKVNGKKLYELARQGKTIEREACRIEIFSIGILNYAWPELRLRIHCGSGAYIRVLGADIGQALGVGAYLTALRRTRIGQHDVSGARKLEELSEDWAGKLLLL